MVGREFQEVGDRGTNLVFVRTKPRLFRVDDQIDVADTKTRGVDAAQGCAQELAAVGVFPRRITIRKQVADVGLAAGSEQGVGQRVQDDVSVAVAEEPAVKRNFDTAQNEAAACHEAVQVIADADAWSHVYGVVYPSQNHAPWRRLCRWPV